MHITSSYSEQKPSGSRSFVVLHHYEVDERVLVLLPKDTNAHFEEIARCVEEEWGLEHEELVFETKELNFCPTLPVKLRRDCFSAGILNEIGNVYIRRRQDACKLAGVPATNATAAIYSHLKGPTEAESRGKDILSSPEYRSDECTNAIIRSDVIGFRDGISAINYDECYQKLAKQSLGTSNAVEQPEIETKAREGREKLAADEESEQSQQATDAVNGEADSNRFVVLIHDGNEANSAAFRVSPEQTMLRVLKGACRHFKLDFSQSALFLSAGGSDRVKCETGATVKSLNIVPYQELVVSNIFV